MSKPIKVTVELVTSLKGETYVSFLAQGDMDIHLRLSEQGARA